ncbi:MAG: hypothetical protein ABGZ24_22585, partial [Fuerstiella sp.]
MSVPRGTYLMMALGPGIGVDTHPPTTIEVSASSSVHVFTLPLAGESGYQARRGAIHRNPC